MSIDSIIEGVVERERGYVNHPNDRGGPTNYGITQAVARLNGYQGDMRDMPRSLAIKIYRDRYVVAPKFDQVIALDAAIGEELVDTGVNMGPATAATFFQRCLNVFNYDGAPSGYSDLFVDGRLGPATLGALKAYLKWRGTEGQLVMLRALNSEQGSRYINIAERDRTQRKFTFGWFSKRVVI